jgi:FkbM family methyltransferase
MLTKKLQRVFNRMESFADGLRGQDAFFLADPAVSFPSLHANSYFHKEHQDSLDAPLSGGFTPILNRVMEKLYMSLVFNPSPWRLFFRGLSEEFGVSPMREQGGDGFFFWPAVDETRWGAALRAAEVHLGLPAGSIGNIERRPGTELCVALRANLQSARQFYLVEHGEWFQYFYEKLADDVSRESLWSFLRQRINAYFFMGAKSTLPIKPPKATEAWRKMRLSSPVHLPHLSGIPLHETVDYFCLHTFILEQYAVPGVVEAQPGDCVIDAGAFIGDTAIYFSNKVGQTGKVYAFDPFDENLRHAAENLRINGCETVCELINAFLADSVKDYSFSVCPYSASSSGMLLEGENTARAVTTIDLFRKERGISIDFIKMDIEGAEMLALHGAERTIHEDKPVCAIALYHREGDIVDIPRFLWEVEPAYTMYMRCEAEPVLFAVKR